MLLVTFYGANRSVDIYALFDDGFSITMQDKEIAEYIDEREKITI